MFDGGVFDGGVPFFARTRGSMFQNATPTLWRFFILTSVGEFPDETVIEVTVTPDDTDGRTGS
jgi:hypothetical protein